MATRTRRRVRYLAWAPPALSAPRIIDYVDAGPYDVTAGIQRADTYQFSNTEDLVVRLPRGGDAGHGLNTRQLAPLNRTTGASLRGGRNILIFGGEIDISTDHVTALGRTYGTPNYYANQQQRGLWFQHSVTGTIHVEGVRITGQYLYEAVDLRSTSDGTTLQLCNIAVVSAVGPDGDRASVRYWPELSAGATLDHDGGDIIQTQTSWGAIRIDGLACDTAWYQGLFLKREGAAVAGEIDLRNISLSDYQGGGGALYLDRAADNSPIPARMHNMWVDTSRRRATVGTGVVARAADTKAVETVVYAAGSPVGVLSADAEGGFVTHSSYLTDIGAAGGKVRAGRPPLRVLSGNPGEGYVSPGYLHADPTRLLTPGR